jgi:hypothetical protein
MHGIGPPVAKGQLMHRWLRLRRERIEQIRAETDALVETLGVGAYSAARRREREASSDAAARLWRRVALAIALKRKEAHRTQDAGARGDRRNSRVKGSRQSGRERSI